MKNHLLIGVLIFSLGGIAYSDEPKRPWLPAWEKAGALNWSNPVEQTEQPFVFRVHKGWGFKSEDEAKAFAKKKKNVLGIVKSKDVHEGVYYYNVTYTELWDLRSLIPADQTEFWAEPKAQFALVLALRRNYGNLDEIVDRKFFHYQGVGHATAAEARARVAEFGEIVELTEDKKSGTVFARHRRAVDIVTEAIESCISNLHSENRIGKPVAWTNERSKS